ncbi:hypothetical protein CLNEO_14720 [Anaerotignum neopropionicum]|uniref:Uncharacterized protein n=1 Tax=Anaerotignum neopropionicum TaxID=36847 RepID=A0A136WEK1_9FIRM|nr:hypothetical protein [Anaerotignum neopropionicum]KXL52930.1 hypothetical protein CLNEO_14720 [Anaerotignum neopropionicum]
MNILGKAVKHKTFGDGTIQKLEKNHIIISFSVGNKTFVFPDAFFSFLTTTDEELNFLVGELLEERQKQKLLAHEKKVKELQQKALFRSIAPAAKAKTRKGKRANVAFKCNFCDGGKSKEQIGFYGVCSDKMIYNNIKIENRTWCNAEDCPCLEYLKGEITREKLDSYCQDNGIVCYESQMLKDWKAFAGVVQNGKRKGKAMKLQQVQKNSLCVLTTRTPGTGENERFIFALFLVDDIYEGDEQEEGYVSTTSKYKIKLSPQEAKKMLFWNYHSNGNKPKNPAWSSGLHRYFTDEEAVQILKAVVEIKKETADSYLAVDFLEYYCGINGIAGNTVGEARGALKR